MCQREANVCGTVIPKDTIVHFPIDMIDPLSVMQSIVGESRRVQPMLTGHVVQENKLGG